MMDVTKYLPDNMDHSQIIMFAPFGSRLYGIEIFAGIFMLITF